MTVTGEPHEPDPSVDIVADTEFAGRPMRLVVEVKGNGQPRMAHQACANL